MARTYQARNPPSLPNQKSIPTDPREGGPHRIQILFRVARVPPAPPPTFVGGKNMSGPHMCHSTSISHFLRGKSWKVERNTMNTQPTRKSVASIPPRPLDSRHVEADPTKQTSQCSQTCNTRPHRTLENHSTLNKLSHGMPGTSTARMVHCPNAGHIHGKTGSLS